jgi:uncharacterized lipoprotein YddW (UPF0748 family)
MLPALLLSVLAAAETPPAPSPPREFRAAWVATVANIDWPSKKGLSTKEQQAELLAILDAAAKLHLNALILQIRPMCDALYASKLEPWSEYLTGRLGQAPEPYYDPLEYAVREAHARGLELHVWLNPYRAHHPSSTSAIPADHIVKRRPDLAPRYGTHHWLIPTEKEVQDHSLAVFLDVVRRYDIDGIHMDDYFYPYKEKDKAGKLIPFPDDASWSSYQKAGGKLPRDDWRRDAVNRFVERLYREVKNLKPHVKVGISPFGIWRPGHPKGIAGLDQYAELYADAKLWLNKGWVDYWTPQLYWPIKQEKQSYPRLLAWWAGENTQGRHLWPGNIPSRVSEREKGWPATEIRDQIVLTRKQKGAGGNVHFSMKALLRNRGGVADELAKLYREPALVPASPWLGKSPPAPPGLDRAAKGVKITPATAGVRLYVLRALAGDKWHLEIVPAGEGPRDVDLPGKTGKVVVTAIDRVGLESEPATLEP